MTIGEEFLYQSRKVFRDYKALADRSIAQLSDEELFLQPDPESNSVAICMKHMAGNMISRWTDFLTTDGEKPDRHRDTEFEISGNDARELKEFWERGYAVFFNAIDSLTENDLLKTVFIRNEPHSVIQAIQRQLSHYSYHTGQIVYIAKHIKGTSWKTLSIPKGGSEEYLHSAPPKN